jgi:DNA-binding transcriptional regulator YhcF (GntR family)
MGCMQFWFAHGTEVSLREQLVTQVVLGIQCGDLSPGQRLTSTRELARRFHLHPNTVSAGYRQLEREGWVEFRRGSGVYVRQSPPEAPLSPALALDHMIAHLFRSARKLGTPVPAVRARLRQWLALRPPDHFLLIEPNEELRRIVAAEMQQAVTLPVKACGWKNLRGKKTLESAILVVLPGRAPVPRSDLPSGAEPLKLQFRSVHASLAEWLPAPSAALVGVASRWPDFLKLGRTMLLAAGFPAESLLFRDARKPNWQRGLKQSAVVVCDAATAAELPKGLRSLVFHLVSDSSLDELKTHQDSIRIPPTSAV